MPASWPGSGPGCSASTWSCWATAGTGWTAGPVKAGPDSIWVDPVDEPRTGKTRVHLDLRLAKPDPGPLLAAGAGPLREPGDHAHWWVLTDPGWEPVLRVPAGRGRPAGVHSGL